MGMEYSLSISPDLLNNLPCSYCGDSISVLGERSLSSSFFCCDCDLPANVLFKRMESYSVRMVSLLPSDTYDDSWVFAALAYERFPKFDRVLINWEVCGDGLYDPSSL